MKRKIHKGFTLIELVVSIAIVSLLVMTILGMFSFALRTVSENRLLAQAITLGEDKMEIIKNLTYDSVGTVGGIPAGAIPQNETAIVNGSAYDLYTLIVYVDDPADGILGTDPSELFGTDYKKIKIQVSWNGPTGSHNQVFITNIAPRRNQNMAGTGTLAVLVFNAEGQAVSQADVHIRAAFATTTVDIISQTNSQGRLVLPGAPAGLNKYSIVASKNTFSTDRTCSIDPAGLTCSDAAGNPTPTKADASVIEGDYTEMSFAIDTLSQLNVKTIRQSVASDWIINTDASVYDQDNPSMSVCSDGRYVFTWRDKRQNNNPRIYAQLYDTNFIKQWDPDLALTTSNNQNNPDVGVDQNCNIYVAWNDDRNGNQDIYFSKTNTSGNPEWGEGKKVDTQAESADQTYPQLVMNASSTFEYVVWQDARNDASDIYAQKFTSSGNSVWANELRINSDATTATQDVPKIQADRMQVAGAENIYFSWHDNRNSNNDVFAQKIDKDGNKLWANDILINTNTTSTDQMYPDFALSKDGPLYFVWQDSRLGNFDIFAQKIDVNGSKIWADDIKINSDVSSGSRERPVIAEDFQGKFYIVWEDTRNGNTDIYMQKIDSDGNKLINFDTRINTVSANEQGNPDIYINKDGNLVISWQDNNGGNFDIKAAVYGSDPEVITNVGDVPLLITGAKRIGENPVIYKYNNNFSTNAGGDLSIGNIEWDHYTITPIGFTLLLSDPPSPITLNPNQNISVILNLQ